MMSFKNVYIAIENNDARCSAFVSSIGFLYKRCASESRIHDQKRRTDLGIDRNVFTRYKERNDESRYCQYCEFHIK